MNLKICIFTIKISLVFSQVEQYFAAVNDDFEPKNFKESKNFNKTNMDDQEEEIKTILEEKYKFRNDGTSTRYRIANLDRDYPEFKGKNDRHIAWAFRSYAVRRIVGGMETSISMYPYNVAISRNGKHWCGGSVIDEQWVLTAGHCLEVAYDYDEKKLQTFIVRAGSSFHNKGGYQAKVNKVFFPKKYVPGSADYDYSLIRLDRPMPIGRNIAVLNLPSRDYAIKEGDILIVTGWGSTDVSGYGHIPDRIRFVPVPVMTLEECQKSYRFYITQRMLCAGYATGGKDACNHDSGGPAVRDGVLLGIVSFGGKQCGDPRSPGVYSRVAEITDWVEEIVTKNEASDVPELKPKIQKARLRERELQKQAIRTPRESTADWPSSQDWVEEIKTKNEASNVPELKPKIQKARLRERELQKFKARVEEKKDKIKSWLRETLKSPSFIELAKKKLNDAGIYTRRLNMFEQDLQDTGRDDRSMDDRSIDEINLTNMINERILGDDDINESERLLRTLAMKEVISTEKSKEVTSPGNDENFDSFIEYVSRMGYFNQ